MRKFITIFSAILALFLLNSKAFAEEFDYGREEIVEALHDESIEFLER